MIIVIQKTEKGALTKLITHMRFMGVKGIRNVNKKERNEKKKDSETKREGRVFEKAR